MKVFPVMMIMMMTIINDEDEDDGDDDYWVGRALFECTELRGGLETSELCDG